MIYSDAKVAQKTHPSLFGKIETLFSDTYCKQYTICQKYYSKMCFLQKEQSTFLSIPSSTQQTFVLVKTYWRRLEDVLKTSWWHNCKMSCKHVLKTSWRRLENVLKMSCKTSWRHFRKMYCRYVLKTSWRRLQEVLEDEKCYAEDVLENKKCLLGNYVIQITNE